MALLRFVTEKGIKVFLFNHSIDIGRESDNDVVIDNPHISRYCFKLVKRDTWKFVYFGSESSIYVDQVETSLVKDLGMKHTIEIADIIIDYHQDNSILKHFNSPNKLYVSYSLNPINNNIVVVISNYRTSKNFHQFTFAGTHVELKSFEETTNSINFNINTNIRWCLHGSVFQFQFGSKYSRKVLDISGSLSSHEMTQIGLNYPSMEASTRRPFLQLKSRSLSTIERLVKLLSNGPQLIIQSDYESELRKFVKSLAIMFKVDRFLLHADFLCGVPVRIEDHSTRDRISRVMKRLPLLVLRSLDLDSPDVQCGLYSHLNYEVYYITCLIHLREKIEHGFVDPCFNGAIYKESDGSCNCFIHIDRSGKYKGIKFTDDDIIMVRLLSEFIKNRFNDLNEQYFRRMAESDKKELENTIGIESRRKMAKLNIICSSNRMIRLYNLVEKAAADDKAPILITGETGTGKELVAKAIHAFSGRIDEPLISVSAANISETLIESELFGHERGAFTGAETKRIGLIEEANKGILFLDEISVMSLNMQAKLLRVIEDKKIRRVGGNESVAVDVRFVCATNRPLDELVKEGSFREDLFYRLSVLKIDLPLLRERKDEIVELAEHFIGIYFAGRAGEKRHKLTEDAVKALLKHDWPGNVRELENKIRSGIVLCDGFEIEANDMFSDDNLHRNDSHGKTSTSESQLRIEKTDNDKKEILVEALRRAGGNQSEAARILGMNRHKLRRLFKNYEIDM